jgi:hypothetical protein
MGVSDLKTRVSVDTPEDTPFRIPLLKIIFMTDRTGRRTSLFLKSPQNNNKPVGILLETILIINALLRKKSARISSICISLDFEQKYWVKSVSEFRKLDKKRKLDTKSSESWINEDTDFTARKSFPKNTMWYWVQTVVIHGSQIEA